MSCGRGSSEGGTGRNSLAVAPSHADDDILKIIPPSTLWFQLEDMFQLIVTPQGIEKVMIQLKDTPSKVYAIGAELFLSKVPLEVLQN